MTRVLIVLGLFLALLHPAEARPTCSPADKPDLVSFDTGLAPGSILIIHNRRELYLTLEGGRALRYCIAVGRPGFSWRGQERVTKKVEWPDWTPPKAMIARQPYLPRYMAGGPGNPLGAAALYLGATEYRIHGSDATSSIGYDVSSGCFRMTNDNILDLYSRVQVGALVVVR